MNTPRWLVPVVAVALTAGCSPRQTGSDAVALVPADERSNHFAAVNQHLELGGTLYGYVDIDGDVNKLAGGLRTLLESAATQQPMLGLVLAQDIEGIFTDLGLGDIKAVGLSSVPADDGGFRNRVYLHTPDGRRGLLTVLGGEPTSFAGAAQVPAGTDLYYDAEMDVAAVYDALRAIIVRTVGEPMAAQLETRLRQPLQNLPARLTALDLIKNAKGRVMLAVSLDPANPISLGAGEGAFNLPGLQFKLVLTGIGGQLKPQLDALPLTASETTAAGKTDYTIDAPLPVPGWSPVITIEGDTLQIISSAAMRVDDPAQSLANDATFQAAFKRVGATGNRLTYVTPRLLSEVHGLPARNPHLPAEAVQGFSMILGNFPRSDRALIGVRVNLPEGVLFVSDWHNSLKSDASQALAANPVTVGLLAAMAIPAFQKVRATSQEKAIINNLRQLDAAAAQHMLETGTASAAYADIVGEGRDKYVRPLKPVAGEDYTGLVIKAGDREIAVTTAAGKVIRLERRH